MYFNNLVSFVLDSEKIQRVERPTKKQRLEYKFE
jgi:hypothetical protein